MSALAVQGLSKTYADGTHALQGISFAAAPGEIVALAGASGCGKTTLLRLLAGLDQADAGTVSVDGQPTGPGPHRAVSAVFQEPRLMPWLSAGDNIGFGAPSLPHAERASRSAALLQRVGLEGLGDRLPKALSGGQQQRVAIARALVGRPGILLLDEPFSALDPFTRRSLHGLLLDLQGELRPTVVMVTHDVDEAVLLADRVIVMRPRPGRLAATVPVPLPRPRDPDMPGFSAVRRRVLNAIEGAHGDLALPCLEG